MSFKTKRFNRLKDLRGMTLIELIIASVILLLVLTVVISTFANFSASKRKLLLSNEVYSQTRFLLERVVREIHNGTIDYQGYWRENLLNETAEKWSYESDPAAEIYEGSNIQGVQVDGSTAASGWGLNSLVNCNDPAVYTTPAEHRDDTNIPEKRSDILYNYRYQFIYPGGASDNTTTSNMVHLNCVDDNFDATDTGGGYNVYDDEPAYGKGPRAFDQGGVYDATRNYVKGSEILWDWDLASISTITNNNPPLMLLKSNESDDLFTRTNIRYKNNKIELIKFQSGDTSSVASTYDNDSPPDGVYDKWYCVTDFECNSLFDGTYLWSQKEVNAGGGNGIGTITDSNLTWTDITPEKIEITSFDFILSPVKDPHRAFFEKDKVQKPQITLIIEAQAKKSAMKGINGEAPKIRLQTTATPRIWELIEVDN